MQNNPQSSPDNDLPGITFIVPAWNCRQYLDECIASILCQRDCHLRIIIVDDGSTDDTGLIADRLAASDPRISVIHKPNGGLSDARNAAIPLVETPYVSFVDSDDALSPHFTATLLPLLRLPDVDMAAGASAPGEEYPWHTPGEAPEAGKWDKPLVVSAHEALLDSLYQHILTCSAWGRIYRREIVQRELFTKGILYEDLDIFHRYCLHMRRVAVSDIPVYFYRQTPTSLLHVFDSHRLDVLAVTRNLTEAYGADPELGPATRDRRFAANFNMLMLCAVHDPQAYERTIRQCWTTITRLRREVLHNRRSRLKNRLGALLSYTGRRFTTALGRRFYLHN